MGTQQELKVFEDKQIRTYWDDVQEKWFFCIADVVEAITDSNDVRQYIKRLRQRDSELSAVWGTICTPHQFHSTDGKLHSVNCSSLEGVFRIIQSITSKKAEPDTDNPNAQVFRRFPQLNVSEVACSIGINKSLLSHYNYGIKKPSASRKEQILDSIRELGLEMAGI